MSRAGLTRDKIIGAAAALADAEGFESLTLTAIARLFGVRLPSLYGHVGSLHALKQGVALLALERLAERSERQARIVELRFFGGLTIPEAAGVLDDSETTVEDEWRFARAWLNRELSA